MVVQSGCGRGHRRGTDGEEKTGALVGRSSVISWGKKKTRLFVYIHKVDSAGRTSVHEVMVKERQRQRQI